MRILCYHSTGDLSADPVMAGYGIPPDLLSEQLEMLIAHGYSFITPDEMFATVRAERPSGRKELCVTFDDGYADLLDAQPVLHRLGITPAVMIVTDYIGGHADWLDGAPIPLLTIDQIRYLADAGWEIGCHSRSHPHLTSVDAAQLTRETAGAREVLVELGFQPRVFAYPHGLHDERVRAAVAAAGFEVGLALESDPVDPGGDPMAVRRMEVMRQHGPLQLRNSLAMPGPTVRWNQELQRYRKRGWSKLKRAIAS